MSITVHRLRRVQIGQEVTENTEVASTAVFIPRTAGFAPNHLIVRPQQDIGLLIQRHPGVMSELKYEFDIAFDVSYEQILYPLNNAMLALASGTGAGADKLWTFTPSVTGANTRKPFTMETRYSDGTNNIDKTYLGCTATELQIACALGQFAQGSWKGYARTENTNAITGALSPPATITLPVGEDWSLRVDATFAGLGTTPITGQMRAFTWNYKSGFSPKWYMDTSKNAQRSARDERVTTLQLKLDQEASAGYGATLRAAIETRAIQYIEIRATGAALGGSNYLIKLQGAYVVEKVSAPEYSDGGEDMITADLQAVYDVTGAQDVKVIVTNADSTLL